MKRFILGIGSHTKRSVRYSVGVDEVGLAAPKERASPNRYLVGIDEVGRGCLAGPVTVAAVALPVELRIRNYELGKLKDSKKLTAIQRERWWHWIKSKSPARKSDRSIHNSPPKADAPLAQKFILRDLIFYAKASVHPKIIDRINISQAANLAATRALKKVCSMLDVRNVGSVLLDGGLYLNNPTLIIAHLEPRTITKGDEKFNCVKLASIVAKVHRDRIMKRLHKKFPQYGFDEHVGYGTKAHIASIKKYGYCELHRWTFLKNFVKSI